MLKYLDTKVVFKEVPNEVTLAINITNCPFRCEGCHTSDLQKDLGKPLTLRELDRLIKTNKGITCVAIMGGDSEPFTVQALLDYVKEAYHLTTCWYSGNDDFPEVSYNNIDYIKIGHYDKSLGGLDKDSTNQRFLKVIHVEINDSVHEEINKSDFLRFDFNLYVINIKEDITYKFSEKYVQTNNQSKSTERRVPS